MQNSATSLSQGSFFAVQSKPQYGFQVKDYEERDIPILETIFFDPLGVEGISSGTVVDCARRRRRPYQSLRVTTNAQGAGEIRAG